MAMNSRDTTYWENRIEAEAAEIKHSSELKEHMAQINFVQIAGGLGVGKTTVIRLIDSYRDGFGQSGSFTTREPRPDDAKTGKYRYMDHSVLKLKKISKDIGNGNLVQAAVHSTTRRIYGSAIEDYNAEYSLLDTVYKVMEDNHRLPFKKVIDISLITDHVSWLKWFNYRANTDRTTKQERLNRLQESIKSTAWSLAQLKPNFVINRENQISVTADKIIRIARGVEESELGAEVVAQRLHDEMAFVIERYEAEE